MKRKICLNKCKMRRHWYCTSTAPKKSVIAAKHPFKAELEAAKRYSWCACGHSRKQPFCDGTHKTIPWAPCSLKFRVEEAKTVWLCGCKHTKSPPYCDGTHKEDWIQKAALFSSPSME
uniref:CDGSH iron-sulfur domain-containing protein 3, mitochondrial-like isoform X2 n=1 Tax=Pristiophorus japonicus TaxID=55135 RepID=UPI00398EA9AB